MPKDGKLDNKVKKILSASFMFIFFLSFTPISLGLARPHLLLVYCGVCIMLYQIYDSFFVSLSLYIPCRKLAHKTVIGSQTTKVQEWGEDDEDEGIFCRFLPALKYIHFRQA